MYHDILTYCEDTQALISELQAKLPHRVSTDEDGVTTFLVPKTPTVRNGNKTLSLIRLTDEDIVELNEANLQTLTILGTYEECFADSGKKSLYDSVYPCDLFTITLEDGSTSIYTPPEKIGTFL